MYFFEKFPEKPDSPANALSKESSVMEQIPRPSFYPSLSLTKTPFYWVCYNY